MKRIRNEEEYADPLDELLRLATRKSAAKLLAPELRIKRMTHRIPRSITRGAIASNQHRSLRQQMRG